MDLLLVRHGITQHNADRVFMGHDPVPLSEEGRRQIAALAERLRSEPIDRIVASDIARARESAEILAPAVGRPIDLEPALREVDVGTAKGVGYDEAALRWPDVFRPDGEGRFPGGESFADVADRTYAFVKTLFDAGDVRVLAVTHGGVVRGLAARLLGLPLAAAAPFLIDNASLSVFRCEPRGVSLVAWNDTGHLGSYARRVRGQWPGG